MCGHIIELRCTIWDDAMLIMPCASVLQVTVLGLIMGSLFFGLKPELTKAPTYFGAAFIMVGGAAAGVLHVVQH